MSIFLPELKYGLDKLEPFLSQRALDFHYGKHFVNYINAANALIKDTEFDDMSLRAIVKNSDGALFNNAAQVLNHEIFFNSMAPQETAMPESVRDLVLGSFNSAEELKEQIFKSATAHFGSGWTWLVYDAATGKLEIRNTGNAANPITEGLVVLLGLDLWEHSYYLDYQNRRADYVKGFLEHIDWSYAERHYVRALSR